MRKDGRQLGEAGRLARALGVTRVARLTGLDRTGVEVASAIRPSGHVLQVTNGKGSRFRDARRGALLEAAELWAAEHPSPAWPGLFESAEELCARGERVVLPADDLPHAHGLRRAWLLGAPLLGTGKVLVPFDAVCCPPTGGPPYPAWARFTTNGMGAHPHRPEALLHAMEEAIERDQLARALPDGFTEGAALPRLIDPKSLPASAPFAAALHRSLRERGFRVHLLDLSASPRARRLPPGTPPPLPLGLPVAAAVILDEEGGPVPAAAGYACRLLPDAALTAALLEAAQSRATEIHGAREDVAYGDCSAGALLSAMLDGARPRHPASALPRVSAPSAAAACHLLARRLARAGKGGGAAVERAAPLGIRVVKVVIPGLLLSELLC